MWKQIKLEKYLHCNAHTVGRWYHTALRSGSNRLEIEKGRWKKLQRKQRICQYCNLLEIEDEKHFILTCPKYNVLRNELFNSIQNISNRKWNFNQLSSEDTFSISYKALLMSMNPVYSMYFINFWKKRFNKGIRTIKNVTILFMMAQQFRYLDQVVDYWIAKQILSFNGIFYIQYSLVRPGILL